MKKIILFFCIFAVSVGADTVVIWNINSNNERDQNNSEIEETIETLEEYIEEYDENSEISDNQKIELSARIRNGIVAKNIDILDKHIASPKSVIFSKNGEKIYVNSLEGAETIVYNFPSLKQRKVIKHTFNADNENLFKDGESAIFDYKFYTKTKFPNHFSGKPVESALSHNGRYLWVTYYRRDYDARAISPSAIAVIDTQKDEIVRVMPTGPLPKIVAVSPDEKILAVVHWGDNSVALMDISSDEPNEFNYTNLLELNRIKNLQSISGNRDSACGECLRGAVFTPDNKYLFVARMGRGGIAVFDLTQNKYAGSILNVANSPRHLVMSNDGKTLYVSSNKSGIVTKFSVEKVLEAIEKDGNAKFKGDEIFVGHGARTIAKSYDEKLLYAVSNVDCKISEIDINLWKVINQNDAPAYPVGLAVSPDGRYVITTSQGRDGMGGNTVAVYRTNKISIQTYIIK